MENLNKLLCFIKLTNDFKKVERDIPEYLDLKKENDSNNFF